MKKQKHLLCMDFESWVVSVPINAKNLSNDTLREWDNGFTLRSLELVLNKLKKNKQKITFFVVFKLEELFPGLIDRILTDGHEVGWHTYSHPRITSGNILIEELQKSKKLLRKYKVKGFQAPEIYFIRNGYKILKEFGFTYSSSIYGNSNILYKFDDVYEIPVSVSNTLYRPTAEQIKFPVSMSMQNVRRFHLPYGSSYFWGLLGKKYYSKKLQNAEESKSICNLFIHNWQVIQPQSSQYKVEYAKYLNFFTNPVFYPYNIPVPKLFDYLLERYSFQKCSDYIYEKGK